MYSGGENVQMNGDTPHDGGHGGGGHGDCEELQRTGRSVTPCNASLAPTLPPPWPGSAGSDGTPKCVLGASRAQSEAA